MAIFKKPSPTYLLTAIVFWLLVILLANLSSASSISTSIALVSNALLMLVLITLSPVQSFLGRLPKPHFVVLIGVFFLFEAAHHLPGIKREAYFPFVQWDMFGHSEDPSDITYFEYQGVLFDGRRVALNVTRYFPPLRHARISAAIWTRLRQHQIEGAEPMRIDQPLEDLFKAVGRAHNRVHPDQRIQSIEIVKSTLDMRALGQARPERRLMAHIALPASGESP